MLKPMLAHKAEAPFDDEHTIVEPKMDGFRLILSTVDGVKAYTRHGNEVTQRFPELWTPPIPPDTILDGELIVMNEGQPDFERVMKRLMTQDPRKVEYLTRTLPVQYVVFDILQHRGQQVTQLSLMERKALLEDALQEDNTFSRIRYIEGNGTGLFQATREKELEGIVIKRKDSIYEVGRRHGHGKGRPLAGS